MINTYSLKISFLRCQQTEVLASLTGFLQKSAGSPQERGQRGSAVQLHRGAVQQAESVGGAQGHLRAALQPPEGAL